MSDNPFKAWLTHIGMTQAECARRFNIPIRTITHWYAGDRECPAYTLAMMQELTKRGE